MTIGGGYLVINLSTNTAIAAYTLEVHPIYAPITWVSVMSYVWVSMALLIVVGVHLLSRLLWTKWRLKKIEEERRTSVLS